MESVEKVYDWEYFQNKTPFRRIFEKYCNLEIDSYSMGSQYHRIQHYDISYDMALYMQNIKEIKQALLKTKMCKYLEGMRKKIEDIPETIEEYENAYAIGRIASSLIVDGCTRHTASSIKYNWDIKNRYSDDMEYNIFCAKRMNRPLIRIFEVNGWERESWNFYFDFPDDTTLELWQSLAKRFKEMPKVNQCNGQTFFELMFVPKEYDSINWECRGGYMAKNNFVEGTLNIEKLKELLTFTDNGLFEYFYKGGVRTLFEN